jgi:hypothetical protein
MQAKQEDKHATPPFPAERRRCAGCGDPLEQGQWTLDFLDSGPAARQKEYERRWHLFSYPRLFFTTTHLRSKNRGK